MKDAVVCWNCSEGMEVDFDDYWEYKQESTFTLVKCFYCSKWNAITWRNSVYFNAVEPDENDLKIFNNLIEEAENERSAV